MTGRRERLRGQEGQSTVEWVGLLLLIALVMVGMVTAGVRVPGTELARTIGERLICAAGIGAACGDQSDLTLAYGAELAELVAEHAPGLALDEGTAWVPTDFRDCGEPSCAAAPESGRIERSSTGEPVTAFTRALDCRPAARTGVAPAGAAEADAGAAGGHASITAGRSSMSAECEGERAGKVYLAYWFYYPDSSTFEGVPLLEERGFHPHDWESYQVRYDPATGETQARASSHKGHNNRRGPENLASDAGVGPVNDVLESIGARPRGGWGEATGWVRVSAGSHAGNVSTDREGAAAHVEAEDLRLAPLETIVESGLDLPGFSPITAPWDKALWDDPETPGTH